MNAAYRAVKETVEHVCGCHIFHNNLPHGTDCFFDISKRFGRAGIKVVFDVGANVGQSAIVYLREFPQAEIYSFEPVAASYRELAAATRTFPRVHAYNLGMGWEAGEGTIHVNPINRISSLVLERPEDRSEPIALETIAGFAKKHQIEHIDFLKTDTEGYELEVLSGAEPLLREQRVSFVLSECAPLACSSGRSDFSLVHFAGLEEFFADFGYRLFGIYEQQPEWDGTNALLYWNALFICPTLTVCGAQLPRAS